MKRRITVATVLLAFVAAALLIFEFAAWAANQPVGIAKGTNGTWAIVQCYNGTTPVTCTEHWVIGSGSVDPNAAYGDEGDLFWRTDLKSFRTKTAGVWGAASPFSGGAVASPILSSALDCTNPAYSFSNNTGSGLCQPGASTYVWLQTKPYTGTDGSYLWLSPGQAELRALTGTTLNGLMVQSGSIDFNIQGISQQSRFTSEGLYVGTISGAYTPIAIKPNAVQSFYANITSVTLTTDRTYTLPDHTGDFAIGAEPALNANYTNATASFTNTNLSVSVLSGQTYNITAVIFASDSTAADGAKLDFNGGSAGATNFRMHCVLSDTTTTVVNSNQVTALSSAFSVATLTGAAQWACQGTLVPSSSGTFIVRGAQNAHTAGTLTFSRGSYMSIRGAKPL
jgi:hypothetical protein